MENTQTTTTPETPKKARLKKLVKLVIVIAIAVAAYFGYTLTVTPAVESVVEESVTVPSTVVVKDTISAVKDTNVSKL